MRNPEAPKDELARELNESGSLGLGDAHETRRELSHGAELEQGRFTIRRELGRGAMGVVYEAFDAERRELVALKTLAHPRAGREHSTTGVSETRINADGVYALKNEFRS